MTSLLSRAYLTDRLNIVIFPDIWLDFLHLGIFISGTYQIFCLLHHLSVFNLQSFWFVLWFWHLLLFLSQTNFFTILLLLWLLRKMLIVSWLYLKIDLDPNLNSLLLSFLVRLRFLPLRVVIEGNFALLSGTEDHVLEHVVQGVFHWLCYVVLIVQRLLYRGVLVSKCLEIVDAFAAVPRTLWVWSSIQMKITLSWTIHL